MSRALIGMISSTATRSFACSVLPVRNEVDDRVGEAGERRELHRAVQLDQVDVHALRREMLARRVHVFGRDADARAALHGPAQSKPRRVATTSRHAPMRRSSGW